MSCWVLLNIAILLAHVCVRACVHACVSAWGYKSIHVHAYKRFIRTSTISPTSVIFNAQWMFCGTFSKPSGGSWSSGLKCCMGIWRYQWICIVTVQTDIYRRLQEDFDRIRRILILSAVALHYAHNTHVSTFCCICLRFVMRSSVWCAREGIASSVPYFMCYIK